MGLKMRGQQRLQLGPLTEAGQHLGHLSTSIHQNQRDVLDAVAAGKNLAFWLRDVRDDIDHVAFPELSHCAPCLILKR